MPQGLLALEPFTPNGSTPWPHTMGVTTPSPVVPYALITSTTTVPEPVAPGEGAQKGPCPHALTPVPTGILAALADLRSAVLSLVVTVAQCLLFSVFAAVPILPVQFGTFVLQVISRSFLYGGNAAFLAIA